MEGQMRPTLGRELNQANFEAVVAAIENIEEQDNFAKDSTVSFPLLWHRLCEEG